MIRKKITTILFILVLIAFILRIFVIPNVLTSFTKSFLESTFSAPVYLKSASISFFPFSVTLKNLRIVNKDKQDEFLFESSSIKCSTHLSKVLQKKLIVENITVSQFKQGSTNPYYQEKDKKLNKKEPMQSDNQHVKKEKNEKTKPRNSKPEQATKKNSEDQIEQLLASTDLEIDKQTKRLADQFKKDKEKFTNLSNTSEIQSIIDQFETNVDSYIKEVEGAKLEEIPTLIKKMKPLKKEMDSIQSEMSTRKNEIKKIMQNQKNAFASLSQSFNRDLKALKRTLQLEPYKSGDLTETILSDKYQSQINTVLKYIKLVQQVITKINLFKKNEESTPRKGKMFQFEKKIQEPYLWVKKLSLTDSKNQLNIVIENISSNQDLVGAPITLSVTQPHQSIEGKIILSKEKLTHQYTYTKKPTPLLDVTLIDGLSINKATSSANGKITLANMKLSGTSTITVSNIQLNTASENQTNQIIEDIIKQTNQIQTTIKFSGGLQEPKLSFSSNLDKKIMSATKELIKAKNEQLNKQLENALKKRAQKNRSALSKSKIPTKDDRTLFAKQEQQLSKNNKELEKVQSSKSKKQKQLENDIKKEAEKLLKQLF